MSRKQGCADLNQKWLLEYGIEITARDSESSKPVSVVCKFYKVFGKEKPNEEESWKRKRSENIQLFNKLWRADNMKDHNNRMHPEW